MFTPLSVVFAQDEAHPGVTRGYEALKNNAYNTAISNFKETLAADPTHKEARFGLGTVYIKMERFRDALDIMEKLVKEYPDDYFIKNNVAWVYATTSDLSIRDGEKAIKFAQDALLSQPGSYHVWSTLSEGYYVSGEYEKAFRAAEQAMKLGQDRKASQENLLAYRDQLQKCMRAKAAMSLIE